MIAPAGEDWFTFEDLKLFLAGLGIDVNGKTALSIVSLVDANRNSLMGIDAVLKLLFVPNERRLNVNYEVTSSSKTQEDLYRENLKAFFEALFDVMR